jgi:hypothetical protein
MSTDQAVSAFSQAEFHSVFDLRQVWMDRPAGHLPLQEAALRRFGNSLKHAARLPEGASPLGLCFVGSAGSGKTHLLSEIRRSAAAAGANFILSDLTDVRDFWDLLAMHFLQSIQREMGGVCQLQRVLELLLRQVRDPSGAVSFAHRTAPLPRAGLLYLTEKALTSLGRVYGQDIRRRCRVFRALMYLDCDDVELSERAYSFLQGVEQIDEESKAVGLSGPNSAKAVVADLAWFLSLTGPTVLAFDQLDPFIAQNNLGAVTQSLTPRLAEALQVLAGVVNGIFAIRDLCPRTLVVLTCLESSWKVLEQRVVDTFRDRFEPEIERLRAVSGRDEPCELVALRLDEAYRRAGFTAPQRTWPFAPGFFETLPPGLTPREILNRCERHRLACLAAGKVIELHSYAAMVEQQEPDDLAHFDTAFSRSASAVDAAALLDENREDDLGRLLGKAARLIAREMPLDPEIDFLIEDDFRTTKLYESLHLRMRRIFRAQADREEHVCVRVLQKMHPRSFQVRLTAAKTVSGISERLEGRRLFVVRNAEIPSGPRTAELTGHAKQCGAVFLPIGLNDIRTIVAVVDVANQGDPRFETWLVHRRPLSGTEFFRRLVPAWLGVLSKNETANPATVQQAADIAPAPPPAGSTCTATPAALPKAPPQTPLAPAKGIFLGFRVEAGAVAGPVLISPVDLARHVLIRAGSGGGKTVFVKRLIEEAALNGISSIVIDTAKDLAMLGDRWKQAPEAWSEEDAHRAQRYHKDIDVRIWTPGHGGGKPLRLAPLPNLTGPFPHLHDRELVVQVAVAGLLPLAVQKKSPIVEKAILTKVVEWLTRQPAHNASELEKLIASLRDLPSEAFQGYQNERKLAAGMADQLQAALVADPLYGGKGEDLDPANLFGVGSSRPRISVLSLFAMPDIDTQARFIGQLASLLFNWIRRTPAPAQSAVRGLFVLDEAARFLPRNSAASKPGLMLLAQQARKYGLGLVLATQNPKDLDYNAAANFSTQLFGTANVVQVRNFIKEEMAQRGLSGLDPGQLKTGEFFCATPSLPSPIRLRGAMCLSAHPHHVQLSDEEIVERALASR